MMTDIIPGKRKRSRRLWLTGALFLFVYALSISIASAEAKGAAQETFHQVPTGLIWATLCGIASLSVALLVLLNVIRQLKRSEEALREDLDGLEKRVGERTTELAETTEALIAAEREKSLFLHVTDALILYYDTEMNIQWANRAACESVRMTREELLQRRCWEIWHQRREPCAGCPVILSRDTGEPREAEMCSPDGRLWFIRGYPVKDKTGRLTGMVEFCQDFTGHKRAEELLRQSEMTQRKLACELAQKNKFLRTLIDAMPDLIFYKDCNRAYLGCNRAFEGFAGRREKDLIGRTDFDVFSRDVADAFREKDLAILSTEESLRNEEWIDYPDGRRVLLETLKTPFFDLDGEILGVVGVSRDITERKRAEELRRKSEENFSVIFQATPDLIAITRAGDGTILEVNEAFTRLLGYSRAEAIGLSTKELSIWADPEDRARWIAALEATGQVDEFETTLRCRDGSLITCVSTARPLDYGGEKCVLSVVRDITERKRMEEELLLSQFCIDQAGIGIYQSDETGTIFNVNEHACKDLGYTREELCALSIFDIDPEITPEKMLELKGILDEKGTGTHYTTHRRKDGTTFPVEIIANHLDFHGKRYGISFVKDITERKRAEEALRESESRVRRKLESILDPDDDTGELDLADILDAPVIKSLMDDLFRVTGLKMSIIDLKGRVLADVGWQDICARFHRNHPETLKRCLESDTDLTVDVPRGEFKTYRCRNNMWHIVTPIIVGERHMGNLFMGQFLFADEQIDYELFRSQARTYGFPEEEYIAALEAVPRHSQELVNLGKAVFLRLTDMISKLSYANIKLARSLTERDRLTETLREASLVMENSPAVLFRWKGDDEWPVELVSGNIIQFGYTQDDFLSGAISYSEIIHPDDLERVTGEVHDFCNEGADQFRLEYRIITRNGGVRWVNEHTHVERDAAGGVSTFEGIVIDVTERKLAEDSIRESREKYQAIVDSFDGFIYSCSQDCRVEFMNRKLIERAGRDAVGEYCYKVMHDRDSVCPWCLNERVFAGEKIHWEMFSPKDNNWYYVVNVPIRHADGSMSKHSMMFDITDRKRFEEELQRQKQLLQELNDTLENRVEEEVAKNREKDIMLIQQNRQAALGEMLDHIAHQWKQPLNSISLIIQGLEEASSYGELTDEVIGESVGKTIALVQHMAQTIDTFRGFYRPDKEKKVFNVKDSIDQALAFIAPALRFHSIAVELDVDPGLTAFGYSKEYAQVLLNILANARDIFMTRGTEKARVIVRAYAEDNKAVVTIEDNGGGIPEAIIGRIFDFYFTTNEAGGGTGIGLYMSRNIIEKNMGGTLSAENTDDGARFRIEISPT
jgi:PAS domain S-box-containing protein